MISWFIASEGQEVDWFFNCCISTCCLNGKARSITTTYPASDVQQLGDLLDGTGCPTPNDRTEAAAIVRSEHPVELRSSAGVVDDLVVVTKYQIRTVIARFDSSAECSTICTLDVMDFSVVNASARLHIYRAASVAITSNLDVRQAMIDLSKIHEKRESGVRKGNVKMRGRG